MRQKVGSLSLVAESQVELAELALDEGHPDKAEQLVRTAIAQFEKEKGDPDTSSAYTMLSRALLMQGKVEDALKAAERGGELSLTSSDPALKLPAAIQRSRVEIATAGRSATTGSTVVATSKRLGYYGLECEGRLALGELEMKTNPALGRAQLTALASEARSHGLELLARKAEQVLSRANLITVSASSRP